MHLLQDWSAAQANRRPDATAVVWNGERLSYAQLEEASNRLARLLREAGCRRGSRVGLLAPKSPTAIVAMLAVLKADAMYVPLDPSSPPARLARIVQSCDDRWILAAGPVGGLLDQLFAEPGIAGSCSVGWLEREPVHGGAFTAEFSARDAEAFPGEPPACANRPSDPAHILFTSGSTGHPKGVVIPHQNVVHFVRWAVEYFGITESDRISGHPPLHFDLSTFDIFGTFAAGAELHPVPAELNLLPHKLAEFIRRAELTQWFSVPSVLNFMAKFDVVLPDDFPSLRRVLWCGEVLPTPTLMHWMRRLPRVSFTNLYGPTEATIASSYYTVPRCPEDEREPIPIGSPCAGEELLVLDDSLRPVPPGEVGDLYLRGVGLSPGYWRDAEKTAGAFLPNPRSGDPTDRIYRTGDLARVGSDGLVYFLGRADTQIKSRGYRIELGEIEAALNGLQVFRECAVVAVESEGFEGAVICCAYAAERDAAIAPAAVRARLKRLLPSYMLPSRWMALEELPKNANGKTDRREVKDRFLAVVPGPAASPA